MIKEFFMHLQHYTFEIFPSLLLGFFLSGILHEFIPQSFTERYLNRKGILPIIYVTVLGIILPVCCFGSLPIAISFRKKGVPLGPVLAFLVATPATSISAILVTLKLFGTLYTVYLCITVIILGLIMGIIGNSLKVPEVKEKIESCPMCAENNHSNHFHHSKRFLDRIVSVFTYAFIDLPKEIGIEIILGILLAAFVASFKPLEFFLNRYLGGFLSYIFSLLFGLIMYICSTASVPLVHAFVSKGLVAGAGLVMLIAGPVTSWGSMLVLKKEFGLKVLLIYLLVIAVVSITAGYLYTNFIVK